MVQFNPLQSIEAFQAGQAQRQQRERRNLLQEVGGQAAKGEFRGAQQTALKAGAFDVAAEVGKLTPEQIDQTELFGNVARVGLDAIEAGQPWGPAVAAATQLLPPAVQQQVNETLGQLTSDDDAVTLFRAVDSFNTSPELAERRRAAKATAGRGSPVNIQFPDRTTRSFRPGDPALDAALESGGIEVSPRQETVTGTPEEFAFTGAAAPTAVLSAALKTIDESDVTLGMISDFRGVLTTERVGVAGAIRRIAQGAAEQAKAFAPALDAQRNQILDDIVDSGSDVSTALFTIDESLAQAELLENVLAYRFAKTMDPSGRVAKDDLKAAQAALGSNKFLTGEVSIGAKLDAFEKMVNRQRAVASRRAAQEQQPQGQTQQAGPPPIDQRVIGQIYDSPRGPVRWTGTGWEPQ